MARGNLDAGANQDITGVIGLCRRDPT